MATQTWPTETIPVKVWRDSWRDRIVDFNGEFRPDVGPPSRWPRSAKAMLEVDFRLALTAEEREALLSFHVTTCLSGSLPFTLDDPITDTNHTWYWREPPATRPRVLRAQFFAEIRLRRFIG